MSPRRCLYLPPGDPVSGRGRIARHRVDHLALWAQPGVLVVDTPLRRHRFRTPAAAPTEHRRADTAVSAVAVLVRHPTIGPTDRPYRHFLVLDGGGQVLGRLDYSSGWKFSERGMREICAEAGIAFSTEAFATEAELLAAHHDWVTGLHEMQIEHPGEEGVREVGLALLVAAPLALGTLGTFIFLALGTVPGPSKYVQAAAFFIGIVLVSSTSLLAWRSHRRKQVVARPEPPTGGS